MQAIESGKRLRFQTNRTLKNSLRQPLLTRNRILALTVGVFVASSVNADVIRFGNDAGSIARQDSRAKTVFRYDARGKLIVPPKPEPVEADADSMNLLSASSSGRADLVPRAVRLGEYSGPLPSILATAARYQHHPAISAAGLTPQEWTALFQAMVWQESRNNASAVSHKGAIGLAQLMPGTAAMLGVNPRDPMQNLDGGARYLLTQLQEFRSPRLALAAYNAGPGAVRKHGGVPPYRETRDYVVRILSHHQRLMAQN